MPESFSSVPVVLSPSAVLLNYRPGSLLPRGEASEVPTQLQPRQPHLTQRPFATQPQSPYTNNSEPQQAQSYRSQQALIMPTHDELGPLDNKVDKDEMGCALPLYESPTSCLHSVTLPVGVPISGGRKAHCPYMGQEHEHEVEETRGGGDILGLNIPTLPPQPNLGKGKPFSPIRDLSGSCPFKRKRQRKESSESRRASASSSRQAIFSQVPILGRAATDGCSRLVQGSPESQPQEGLCLSSQREPPSQNLRLSSQNQGSQNWPRGLGLDSLDKLTSQLRRQSGSKQQMQSFNQGPSFVREPWAACHGSLLGFQPVNRFDNKRSKIDQLREGRHQVCKCGGACCPPSSFYPRHETTTSQVHLARHGPTFLGEPNLRNFMEADDFYDDYDHHEDQDERSSPQTARTPPACLPHFSRLPTLNDASKITSSDAHTKLLSQPSNPSSRNLTGCGNEEEIGNALTPNERRRRILGQHPFMTPFHQQVYSQGTMRSDFVAAFPPAYKNSSVPNDSLGRRRASIEDPQSKKSMSREECPKLRRYSRLHQGRLDVEDINKYNGDKFTSDQVQAARVGQPGPKRRGLIGIPRLHSGYGERPPVRPLQVQITFYNNNDEGGKSDEDHAEGERLAQVLQRSGHRGEEQRRSAHLFGLPAQRPAYTIAATTGRRSSAVSVSVQAGDLPSTETIRLLQQMRQRVQRQPNFMQHAQASQKRVSSVSSAEADSLRPSSRQSFIHRISRKVSKGGSWRNQRERGGLAPAERGHDRGSPSPMSPHPSLLSSHGNWSGQPQRSHGRKAISPSLGRDMDEKSSADEASAPPRTINASIHGCDEGRYEATSGRERGEAHIPGINTRPAAINHNYYAPNHPKRGRPRQVSAATAMACLGLGVSGGKKTPCNPLSQPHAPLDVQSTPYIGGRAVYSRASGGMMLMRHGIITPASKPKVLFRVERLRAQAAAQIEAIQAQLKAAEEEALTEEAAQAKDNGAEAEGMRLTPTMEDVWEGEVEPQIQGSIKPIERMNKGNESGKIRTPSDMMNGMKAAARALGPEGDDKFDGEGGDRGRANEHAECLDQLRMSEMIKAARFDVTNVVSCDQREDYDGDIDESEADLMTKDEGQMDGERMGRGRGLSTVDKQI